MRNVVKATVAALFLVGIVATPALATKPSPDHKATICHRTASDTNPYVFIDVDVASLDAHLNNLPGHPAKHWKSDGTWRGVPHVKGDLKNDYLAKTKADCEQTPEVTPSPTPAPTTAPSPTPTATPTTSPSPSVEPSPSTSPSTSPTPTVTPSPTKTPAPPVRPTNPPTDTVSPVSSTGSSPVLPVLFLLTAISGAAWWTRRIAIR